MKTKKLFFILMFVLFALQTRAQAPQKFNYQAVVRDAQGNVLPNSMVSLITMILDGSATGNSVYSETHTTTTNQFGLVSLEIGNGTNPTGIFNNINWSSGAKYLKIEINLGSGFVVVGTPQLLSVPYALYSNQSGTSGLQGATGPTGLQGAVGPTGASGTNGTNGVTGAQGIQGIQGIAGAAGAAGKGYNGLTTSTSINVATATGSTTITTNLAATATAFTAGNRIRVAYTSVPTNFVEGTITSFTGNSLVFSIDYNSGAGTYTSFNIVDAGVRGATGAQGTTGPAGGAQGVTGPTGPQGIQGIAGTAGVAGTNGVTGAQGIQGVTGVAGIGYNGLTTTTTLNVATATGSTTLTTNLAATATAFTSGSRIRVAYSTIPTNYVEGTITSFTGNSLVFTIDYNAGAGSYSTFKIIDAGVRGATGATGATGTIGATGATGAQGPTGFIQTGTLAGDMAYWSGSAWVMVPTGMPGQVLTLNSSSLPVWSGNASPSLTTSAISNISTTTATGGGNITSDNGSAVTARGVCWSTSQNPTIAGSKTTDGTGTGSFISSITGLSSYTLYYVRAYATNAIGTSYGLQLSFTTTSSLSIGQAYQGGKIAYIFQPGDPGYIVGEIHGLICAVADTGNQLLLGCNGTNITGTGTALGTGQANTNAFILQCGASPTCPQMCDVYTHGGYSDWYLPSKDELSQLYVNKVAIGGTWGTTYWSSSNSDASNAWRLNMGSGSMALGSKANIASFRPVRTF